MQKYKELNISMFTLEKTGRTAKRVILICFYLHVVHDELEEPSQGAAFLLYTRIHFSTVSEKSSSTSQTSKLF